MDRERTADHENLCELRVLTSNKPWIPMALFAPLPDTPIGRGTYQTKWTFAAQQTASIQKFVSLPPSDRILERN